MYFTVLLFFFFLDHFAIFLLTSLHSHTWILIRIYMPRKAILSPSMVLQKTDYRKRNVKNLYISFLLQKKLFLTSTTKSKRLFKILSVMNAFVPLSMKAKAIAIISTTRSANCLIVCAWNCSLHLDPNLDDDDEWKTDRKGSSKKVFFSVTVPLLS